MKPTTVAVGSGALVPSRRTAPLFLVALALLLLSLGLLLAGAAVARPGVALRADDPAATRTLVRFYGVEQNATDSYRWSEPLAGVFLYGYEGRPARVTLRLAAPRPPGVAPAELTARAGDTALGRFAVGGGWRRYQIVAPTRPAGESALLLETPGFVPEGDPRELGFALSAVSVAPTGAEQGLPPVRALFLLALPLLGWLLLIRLGAPAWAALAAGALLAAVVGWAAAFPTEAGYWLPTLGWPWVPALPLLLLAAWPQLGASLGTTRAWIAARPVFGWVGLAVAFAAVVGMRVGLPWPLGMGLLAGGVWGAMQNATCKMQNGAAGMQHVTCKMQHGAAGMQHATCNMQHGAAGAEAGVERRSLAVPLGLGAVVVVALFLRLWNLDGQPAGLWRDESRHGLQALRIWSDPSYRPIYVVEGADLPALLFYLMAPVLALLGPHAWSVRLVSAVAGALTPLALYWAAAPMLGRRPALLAAALLACASWALSMSRWAFPATLDHLLVLTAVGLLCRGLDGGRWTVDGGRWTVDGSLNFACCMLHFAFAGLLGGLAVYAYHTGRVAPLALGAVAVIRLGSSPAAWRRAAPGLAVAAVVGALTVAPLAAYILGDLDGYNRRVGSVSVLDNNDPQVHSPAGLVLGNLGRYLLMFHVQGDSNGRHHMPEAPMLDPMAGLLLALGLGVAFTQARRQPGAATVLALGAVYLIPGVFSGNAPHAMRSLGTLAPAAMLAGLGLSAVLPQHSTAASWKLRSRKLQAALVLGASLLFNAWLYFGVMRVEPRVYGEFDLVETAMGRVAAAPLASADPELRAVRVYLPDKLRDEDTVRFLTWGQPTYGYSGAPLPGSGPALVLLPGDASAAAQSEAMAALGSGALALGPTPSYPGTSQPIMLAFGRGAAAARLLVEALR